jgi:hypothetical protein
LSWAKEAIDERDVRAYRLLQGFCAVMVESISQTAYTSISKDRGYRQWQRRKYGEL